MGLLSLIEAAWNFLSALPREPLVAMFWLTVYIELPRYFLGLQATAFSLVFFDDRYPAAMRKTPPVSILLVGHNEEGAIEKCVRSLREQSFHDFEIVCVDDGSTDQTFKIMSRMAREGLVQTVARLSLRGGKASGINLAASLAKGNIFVVVDCDCSFEHDAIEELIRPLVADPNISVVSGNILVRNWEVSLTASMQAIEYLVSISLGKSFSDMFNQVCCASGAFGAFDRKAWEHVQGMDPGGGEDLDFTFRARLAGYKVVFTRRSICYTDVPTTITALINQRNRWERDAFWIRFRKFQRTFNPLHHTYSWREAIHQWDFVLFNMVPTLIFPIYLVWLLTSFGDFAFILLIMVAISLSALDVISFLAALVVTGKYRYWSLIFYLPVYGLFQSYLMRGDRVYAYVTEWIYSLSLKDNYAPQKIRNWTQFWR